MKKRKRWIKTGSFLLAGMLLLGGCGTLKNTEGTAGNGKTDDGDGAGSTAMGRYMETELSLEDMMQGNICQLLTLSDGNTVILNEFDSSLISEDQGQSFHTYEIPVVDQLNAEQHYVMDLKMNADGTTAVIYDDNTEEESVDEFGKYIKYIVISPEGETTELTLPLSEDEYARNVWISPEGDCYFASVSTHTLYRVKKGETEGTPFLTIDEDAPRMLSFAGDLMIMDGYDYEAPLLYDLKADTYVEDTVLADFVKEYYGQRSFNGSSWFDLYLFQGKEDGVIYLAGTKGLHRYVIGGSAVEQVIDGSLSRLSSPSYGLCGMVELDNQEFLAVFNGGIAVRFVYDPDIAAVPSVKLKAYSLSEDTYMQAAVTEYQVNNPDVYVEYEIGMEEGSSVTKEDALKKLNTQILAGQGPDILIMDGMPLSSYIEKGLLLDLTDTVADMEQDAEFFDNVIEAMKQDGGIYTLPCTINLPMVFGRQWAAEAGQGLTQAADAIEKLQQENPESQIFQTYMYSPVAVMKRFAIVSAPAWIREDGTLDEEKIKEFLVQTKRIYEAQMKSMTPQRQENFDMYNEYFIDGYGENWAANINFCGLDEMNYLGGESLAEMGMVDGTYNYGMLTSVKKVDGFEDVTFAPMNGQSSDVFIPQTLVSVSAGSKNQEQALDFLRMFFSVKYQGPVSGFSINKDGLRENFAAGRNASWLQDREPDETGEVVYGILSVGNADGLEATLNVYWPNEEAENRLYQLIEQVKVPYLEDETLETAVFEEGKKYLEGSCDEEEAVRNIREKLAIYMAE